MAKAPSTSGKARGKTPRLRYNSLGSDLKNSWKNTLSWKEFEWGHAKTTLRKAISVSLLRRREDSTAADFADGRVIEKNCGIFWISLDRGSSKQFWGEAALSKIRAV